MTSTSTSANNPDVIVIGGGLIGSSIALRLAQAKLRVSVFDRGEPGAEASSAAAGMIGPQGETAVPDAFFALCAASHALFPDFVAEIEDLSGQDVGFRRDGSLLVATDEKQVANLEKLFWNQSRAGLPLERLTVASLRSEWAGRGVSSRREPAGCDRRKASRKPREAFLEPIPGRAASGEAHGGQPQIGVGRTWGFVATGACWLRQTKSKSQTSRSFSGTNPGPGCLWRGSRWPASDRSGQDVGFRRDGSLLVATDQKQVANLEKLFWNQSRAGLPLERLTVASLERKMPGLSKKIRLALGASEDHWVDNEKLTRAVIEAAHRLGVKFQSRCAVE